MRWALLAAVPILGWLLFDHLTLRRRVFAVEAVAPMLRVHTQRVAKALALRGPTLALLVDDRCITCRDVYRRFCEAPTPLRRIVIGESDRVISTFRNLGSQGTAELYGKADVFVALDNGVHPSLLLLDFRGVVLECTPIGSVEALDATVSILDIGASSV